MNRTLVIPDVHNRIDRADWFLRELESIVDRVVFLGDYFDDWGDGPIEAERTARRHQRRTVRRRAAAREQLRT